MSLIMGDTIMSDVEDARTRSRSALTRVWKCGGVTLILLILSMPALAELKSDAKDIEYATIELTSGETLEGTFLHPYVKIRTSTGVRKVRMKDVRSFTLNKVASQSIPTKKSISQRKSRRGKKGKIRTDAEFLLRQDFDISCVGGAWNDFLAGAGRIYTQYAEQEIDEDGNAAGGSLTVPVPLKLQPEFCRPRAIRYVGVGGIRVSAGSAYGHDII